MTKKQLEKENRILRKIIIQGQPYNKFENLLLLAKELDVGLSWIVNNYETVTKPQFDAAKESIKKFRTFTDKLDE